MKVIIIEGIWLLAYPTSSVLLFDKPSSMPQSGLISDLYLVEHILILLKGFEPILLSPCVNR